MMSSWVEWRGQREVKQAMGRYMQDVRTKIIELADRWAVEFENYAKDNRPWSDRTSNARQALFSLVETGDGKVIIYLSHGVEYGVWLELKNQGRYAIIMPTLEHYYAQVQQSYKRLLS